MTDGIHVAVIGLGFVGLPLATHFAEKGLKVTGFDIDEQKINQLSEGKSYIPDVPSSLVQKLMGDGNLHVSLPRKVLVRKADYIIMTVPTPVSDEQPDLTAVRMASRFVACHLKKGQTIILESSTYPGTLEEVILPILEKSKLRVGKDFFLGYSPERIDPGNPQFTLQQIPKVVSGQTDRCLQKVIALYEKVFDQVVPVSSPKVAEMCKLFENIQRLVNISLVNEMDVLCETLGINFREALHAASTKPFGFTPYWPGPGIGGHCIPVDPIYFQWKAQKHGLTSRLIEQAHCINQEMPLHVMERVKRKLGATGDKPNRILLIGLTYKKDVNDLRESPALEIFRGLLEQGFDVNYTDPYVPSLEIGGKRHTSCDLTADLLLEMDVTVVLTDHSNLDWKKIKKYARRLIDTRGVLETIGKKVI